MADRSDKIDAILCAATELPTPAARADFVRLQCGDDDEMRLCVEGLLAAHFRAGAFLEQPVAGVLATDDVELKERPGTILDRYKLLEQIGEGGFATVFMAQQEQPIRRRVAIKVIKAGMDTRQTIARFEGERQALALMDHPHIAKVLDGGATETGRPYFVMELVKGAPITEYCDRQQLSLDSRLKLFIQVCQAVEHAHQKGVIHRDLKPNNVLVSTHDDVPLAKVIDFGIAKALETRLTEKTLFTDFRQFIGTPSYMSPEQADGSLDIDTRSDVYSLGVLLYELLAGAPPFDPKDLKSKAIGEMQRIIREVDPLTPSARLGTLDADTRTQKAGERQLDPKQFVERLRGELEWIVMRTIEKDRNRRYQSAAALGSDVRRYQNNEPVEARPATPSYRFRKFARRNKGVLIAVGLIGVTLAAATAVSTWQAVRASRAELSARANEKRAVDNAHRAEAVSSFLTNAFRSPDAKRDGRSVTIVEVLDRTVGEINAKYTDDPILKAALLDALSQTYLALGLDGNMIPLAEEAMKLREKTLGDSSPETLSSMGLLAMAYSRTGRYSESVALAERNVRLREDTFGPDADETSQALAMRLIINRVAGKSEEPVPLFKSLAELPENANKEKVLRALHDIAAGEGNAQGQGIDVSTVYEFEELLDASRKSLGENHSLTLKLMDNLGLSEYRHDNFEKSRALWQESLRLRIKNFGATNADTLWTIRRLAELFGRVAADDPRTALREIDALAAIAPNDSLVQAARKKALALVRPAPEMISEFVKSIQSAEDQPFSNSPRKTVCRQLAEMPEAFNAVAALLPDETTLWIGRGQYRVMCDRLDEASSDYEKVIRQRRLQDEHYEYGSLLLLRGDAAGYQSFCKETLERSGEPEDEYTAYVAARLYGLGPAECVEPDRLVKWAEIGAKDRRAWQLQALGQAYLRASRSSEAVAQYRESIPFNSFVGHDGIESWFGLAIANHQLGDVAEALRCLQKGRTGLQAVRPQGAGGQARVSVPSTWLLINVMSREAEALLKPTSTGESPGRPPAEK